MALFTIADPQKIELISRAQARRISRENTHAMRVLERRQNRSNVPQSEYLSAMQNADHILEVEHLCVGFFTDNGVIRAVDDGSFSVPRGKTVCIAGESGCGKSVTCLSLMQLLPRPQGQITSGAIRLSTKDGVFDIANMPQEAMQRLRGNDLAMVFQEPMTSLNPVLRVGRQIDEAVAQHHRQMTRDQVKNRTLELLALVEIPDGESVYQRYPHELSGGMRQRVMIAIALSCNPSLIIADEPTTALDVTIQAQILDLLRSVRQKTGASILLVTHDLGVIAGMADFVVVMYAGRIVEQGRAEEIFSKPAHPYTIGLMQSRPVPNTPRERLYSIPGAVPNPLLLPDHCYFRARCASALDCCDGCYPDTVVLSETHFVNCHLLRERRMET